MRIPSLGRHKQHLVLPQEPSESQHATPPEFFLGNCPSLLSIADEHHDQNQRGRTGFMSSYTLQSVIRGGQDRNLASRTKAEAMED